MVLKLSGHLRNTVSLLYMQKTGWKSDIWNFFSKKIDFLSILVYVHWKSAFWDWPCLKTSLWRHTLTDFHDFGINGKRRPYPIPWYQTNILYARQFQVHKGVVTTPLGKPCYTKRLGRTRVKQEVTGGTRSKAFDRSNSAITTLLRFSKYPYQSWRAVVRASEVVDLDINPNCRFVRIPLVFKWQKIFLRMIFSNSLPQIGCSDMGR